MTNDESANMRMVGNLRALDGRGVVHMEDAYETDIDDLWSAVTTATVSRAGLLMCRATCRSEASSMQNSPAVGTDRGAWMSANRRASCG